jgi:hypothetical protein
MFLMVASGALSIGVLLVYGLRRWLGNLRWPVVAVFLLSIWAGASAARSSYGHMKPARPDIFIVLAVAVNLPSLGALARRTFSQAPGPRLYTWSRPGDIELTWSGRIMVLVSAILFLVLLKPGFWAGWTGECVGLAGTVYLGLAGCFIAGSLGRVELRANGILRSGVLYPWYELGKFEWMPGDPSVLRIQVRRAHSTISDIRIECPDDPEINAILTGHGLVRW